MLRFTKARTLLALLVVVVVPGLGIWWFAPAISSARLVEQCSTGHQGAVKAVAYSPDGKLLASGGDDGIVMLWDPRSLRVLARIHRHSAPVLALSFSPTGKMLVSGSDDGVVVVWNITAKRSLARFTANSEVAHLEYSPDGRTLLVQTDATVRFYQTRSWAMAQSLKTSGAGFPSVTFLADSQRVVVARMYDSRPSVWSVSTGKKLADFRGEGSFYGSLSAGPDRNLIATLTWRGGLRLYDAKKRQQVWRVQAYRWNRLSGRTRFSPDGSLIATVAPGGSLLSPPELKLWNPKDGRLRGTIAMPRRLTQHSQEGFTCLAFRPDSSRLATGHVDGTIRTWRIGDALGAK